MTEAEEGEVPGFQSLPEAAVARIFTFLPALDIAHAACTCKSAREAAEYTGVWLTAAERHLGSLPHSLHRRVRSLKRLVADVYTARRVETTAVRAASCGSIDREEEDPQKTLWPSICFHERRRRDLSRLMSCNCRAQGACWWSSTGSASASKGEHLVYELAGPSVLHRVHMAAYHAFWHPEVGNGLEPIETDIDAHDVASSSGPTSSGGNSSSSTAGNINSHSLAATARSPSGFETAFDEESIDARTYTTPATVTGGSKTRTEDGYGSDGDAHPHTNTGALTGGDFASAAITMGLDMLHETPQGSDLFGERGSKPTYAPHRVRISSACGPNEEDIERVLGTFVWPKGEQSMDCFTIEFKRPQAVFGGFLRLDFLGRRQRQTVTESQDFYVAMNFVMPEGAVLRSHFTKRLSEEERQIRAECTSTSSLRSSSPLQDVCDWVAPPYVLIGPQDQKCCGCFGPGKPCSHCGLVYVCKSSSCKVAREFHRELCGSMAKGVKDGFLCTERHLQELKRTSRR